jgi:hypothetical protein
MLNYNLDESDVPSRWRLFNGSRGIVVEFVPLETCQRELEEEEKRSNAAPTNGSTGRMSGSSILRLYCEELDRRMVQDVNLTCLPRVQFANGIRRIISPVCFKKILLQETGYNGYVFRLQLPIKSFPFFRAALNALTLLTSRRLAWCLTVHKAQGSSIDFLEVDLGGCFEYGQAYVPSTCPSEPNSNF